MTLPSTSIDAIRTHYFTDHTRVRESPVIVASLVAFFAFSVLGFLVYGASPHTAGILGVLAVASFTAFTMLHIGLWIIGTVYVHGLRSTLRTAVLFTTLFTVVGVGVIVAVYGWVIPVALITPPLAAHAPSAATPFIISAVIVFAFTWSARAISLID